MITATGLYISGNLTETGRFVANNLTETGEYSSAIDTLVSFSFNINTRVNFTDIITITGSF